MSVLSTAMIRGAVVLALALVPTGCDRSSSTHTTPTATPTPPRASASAASVPSSLPLPTMESIGKLQLRRSKIKASLPSYQLKARELTNLAAMKKALKGQWSAAAEKKLVKDGFVLLPWQPPQYAPDTDHHVMYGGRVDDMVDLYGEISGPAERADRRPEHAVFISTDVLLHCFHVLVDRAFQRIEERQLQPRLKKLTALLFAAAARAQKGAKGAERESLERVTAFLLVPLAILRAAPNEPQPPQPVWADEDQPAVKAGPADSPAKVRAALQHFCKQISAKVYKLARAELDLVLAAKSPQPSPLWSELSPSVVDYTQFTPRSHYTRSAILRSYFRAMMWFGLRHFALSSPALTRDALVLTRLLATTGQGDEAAAKLFEQVVEPTAFFVGNSDDAGFAQYQPLAAQVFGTQASAWSLGDRGRLEAFCAAAARGLAEPRIRPAAFKATAKAGRWARCRPGLRGFRLIGQRFIPDSYYFTRLTTGKGLPTTPTALMVMSVLGSGQADELLRNWLQNSPGSEPAAVRQVLGELKSEVAGLDQQTWGSTLYYGWLFALRPLLAEYDDGYPMFMRGPTWSRKGLLTALGSWTELRHDTLLYAKQSGAEKDGGDAEQKIPPVPKGYVEPNLEFLARLDALVRLTNEGLAQRKLIGQQLQQRFETLTEILAFCTNMVEKQLTNSVIDDEQYERLRRVHFQLRWALEPVEAEVISERDARAAIIADVHTDAQSNRILYEATGAPWQILVAVKDAGGARITRGAIYSYYEFTQPIARRLSDEKWQQRVYGKPASLPAAPGWVSAMAGAKR